ncbi:MAG: DNA mismatch repair endonuclease MutL [Planctomycetota bacterium]|nr:DNA mismatch repair endonuclease MutL [Planctomycetota bacterium]
MTPLAVGQASSTPTSRRIQALSPLVASQIAAGEVVERPASVVKELVENAIDAGSSRIEIDLEGGGIELVRVSDDGCGIHAADLLLAITPHATSKINSAADLERVGTLGFRGEALASIASVSRLSIRSRTHDEPTAFEIIAEGEAISPPRPAAGPPGTQVAARTLFFNTPARRKFLRTVATEQARCVEIVHQLAMAQPAIALRLRCDGRVALDLPPRQQPVDRALAILGKELSPELLTIHADDFDELGAGASRGVTLWGLIGRPSLARATNKAQHLFINGRAVRDRTIQHALAEAFRGLIEPSRYPTAVVMIEMDPALVDVNVHPTKAEVRFRDTSLIHGVVLGAARRALRAADLTPTLDVHSIRRGPMEILASSTPAPALRAEDFVAFIKSARPAPDMQALNPKRETSPEAVAAPPAPATLAPTPSAPFAGELAPALGESAAPSSGQSLVARPRESALASTTGESFAGTTPLTAPAPAPRLLQVHNSYVLTQDEQGVLIIDQHALHERVMFEYLLLRLCPPTSQPMGPPEADAAAPTGSVADPGPQPLESQRFLTPVPVDASPRQVDRLGSLRSLLVRLGIDAQALGPTSVGVFSFPSLLLERGVEPAAFMADLLGRSDDESFLAAAQSSDPRTAETALRDVLDMMACKAAVKAGDRLSELELTELLRLREAVERSSSCPHGRPTTVRLSIRDLEKLFHRA